MKPSDQRRFLFINFTMDAINDKVSSIYEGLADNNQEETLVSIDELYKTLEDLTEQISDGAQTTANAGGV